MEMLEDNGFEANVAPTDGCDGSVTEILNKECFRLALKLWKRCLEKPYEELQNSYETRINKLSNRMLDSDKAAIIWYSKRISKLSSNWAWYHQKHVFQNCRIDLIAESCLSSLIWRPDGSIDSLKTMEALMENGDFSLEVEYKLSCWYCMEERSVFRVWPVLVNEKKFMSNVFTVQELSLFSYWNRRMSDDVPEAEIKSMENDLMSNKVADNLSAAVYFFDRLESDERVDKGCQLIGFVKSDERAEYVATMTSKFDEDELRRAFQFHSSSIICPLLMNRVYNKYAVKLWDRVRNTLTIQSFLSVMTRISGTLRFAYKDPDVRFLDEPDDCDDFKRRIFTVIADLWKITPARLRRHRCISDCHSVTYNLVGTFVRMKIDNDPDARFLSAILADAGATLRRRAFKKIADGLLHVCSSRVIADLMKCLNESDQKKIRQELISRNEKRMEDWFRDKRFAEVDEFLELFESTPPNECSRKCEIFSTIGDPPDYFSYPYEFTDEQVEQLQKFLRKGFECKHHRDEEFEEKFYLYHPSVWMNYCEPYRNMIDYAKLL